MLVLKNKWRDEWKVDLSTLYTHIYTAAPCSSFRNAAAVISQIDKDEMTFVKLRLNKDIEVSQCVP